MNTYLNVFRAFCALASIFALNDSAMALSRGAKIVNSDDLIAQVSVKVLDRGTSAKSSDCSGTRISGRFILTAGHCLGSVRSVVLSDGTVVKVKKSHRHPKYRDVDNYDNPYDFALLELEGHVPAGPVAELATKKTQPKRGDVVGIAGFGHNGNQVQGKLRKSHVTIADSDYSKSEITSKGNVGICNGDSGGAGYQVNEGRVILWGVVSAGLNDDRYGCSTRGVFSKVSTVHSWITAMVDSHEHGPSKPVQLKTLASAE